MIIIVIIINNNNKIHNINIIFKDQIIQKKEEKRVENNFSLLCFHYDGAYVDLIQKKHRHTHTNHLKRIFTDKHQ